MVAKIVLCSVAYTSILLGLNHSTSGPPRHRRLSTYTVVSYLDHRTPVAPQLCKLPPRSLYSVQTVLPTIGLGTYPWHLRVWYIECVHICCLSILNAFLVRGRHNEDTI
jgi:hypothetical protein